ncbi:hypothetical protein ATANTOWER_018057 [Ataeniobius toweri]|uniref:Uncharacterized protein n=1 Tax=Ataeniobius toweri TaxID=208326 RepID=A0ABU7AQ97_9TELE|nr:hypothetical protein [Ataeniobius toweri]
MHSPSKANGLILLFNAVDQLGCVSVPFPSELLFSVRSCSLVFCEETTTVPSFSIAFMVPMLSPVSPLLGFSVIAQPTLLSFSVIAQHLVMVIVTFWFCFSASEMPVIATQLAVDSSSIPCAGLQRIHCQHAAGSRHP